MRKVVALVVVLLLGVLTDRSVQAQTFTSLYSFAGTPDGANPNAALGRDADGNLYGTTTGDGSSGYGVVFKLDQTGTETVLHSFAAGADGEYPYAGLVRDTKGNLYGTTYYGGSYSLGTVFKVDMTGTETVLHSFAAVKGAYPDGGLIRDKLGNLYGTTFEGGTYGFGTVFKLSSKRTLTVLHSFTGGADGGYPTWTSLLRDGNGNLYGVTNHGGNFNCAYGCGVVYKLSSAGTETVLHRFKGGAKDGAYPYGTLARDASGNLYGTTSVGGSSNAGTVWKVMKNHAETVLHSFAGGTLDGETPYSGVIMDGTGSLYGVTQYGGGTGCYRQYGCGVVFKLDTTRTETILHSFADSDGAYPQGGLIQDAAGNLYGDTDQGGSYGLGTVWELTP